MPFRLGPWEIALIVIIILIVFGAGKLPQIGEAVGKGISSFRKGKGDEEKTTVAETKAPDKARAGRKKRV